LLFEVEAVQPCQNASLGRRTGTWDKVQTAFSSLYSFWFLLFSKKFLTSPPYFLMVKGLVKDRLEFALKSRPALADVPIFMVGEQAVSLRDLVYPPTPEVAVLKRQIVKIKKVRILKKDLWKLAEAYYSRQAEKLGERYKILRRVSSPDEPSTLTVAEVLQHIKSRDKIGQSFVEMYSGLRDLILEMV